MFYKFKVATFCFDDNLLLAFCQSASWGSHLEGFYNSLEGVPQGAVYFSAATPSLCGSTHPKPPPQSSFWFDSPHLEVSLGDGVHWQRMLE